MRWPKGGVKGGTKSDRVTCLTDVLATVAEAVEKHDDSRAAAFIHRSLLDLAMHQDLKILFGSSETMQEGSNLRDIQMGINLAWLADEYYAGRKIIVWAASRHIAHDLQRIDTRVSGFA